MEVTVMPNPASVEKQQGLNQVVINKVQRMVEGKRQGVMETIARLLDEGKIAQDFIAPIGVNLRGKEKQPVISFRAADRVQMTMPEGNFSLHGNAISQISEKMGVPAKYLRELSGGDVWQKQLKWLKGNTHKRFLIHPVFEQESLELDSEDVFKRIVANIDSDGDFYNILKEHKMI